MNNIEDQLLDSVKKMVDLLGKKEDLSTTEIVLLAQGCQLLDTRILPGNYVRVKDIHCSFSDLVWTIDSITDGFADLICYDEIDEEPTDWCVIEGTKELTTRVPMSKLEKI